MGGFYGSIQIRTEDRDAAVRAASAAVTRAGIRCLIGPLLNGWVGIYPEGSGQDRRIGETIAEELGGEVLQAIVHDDDVMAYWFWHERQLTDSYWSNPGYFNPADRAAQEQMSGDPQAFGPLMANHANEMLRLLARRQKGITFEASRLRQFAELLGIHNAVTSYEILKSGERAGIEGWEEFTEFPSDEVIAERAAAQQRQLAARQKKQQLRRQHLLLADQVEEQLLPRACAAGGGMVVAWEGYGRGEPRIELFRAPWGEAEPGEIETGGFVNSLVCDAAGRRMAMGLGNRVVVWESAGWKPVLELVEDNWAVETALSPGGDLLAYASHKGVYVHAVDSGQRVTALSAHGGPALAFHPSNEYLISAGNALRLAAIGGTDPWRELYPGGQLALRPDLSQAVRDQMSHVNVDALQEKWRASIESAVEKLAATGNNSPAGQQLVAKMRLQMEKQLADMRAKFASLKAGQIAAPRQGNEAVLCAGFTRDGSRLWLGTDRGLRIYDWTAVQSAPGGTSMPKPLFSHNPASANGSVSAGSVVYAALELPDRNALLFGGYAGKLCQIDLITGSVSELAAPPDGGAIVGITLSADASAVGICSRPALGEAGGVRDERSVWQIWSYPALFPSPAPVHGVSRH